MLSKKVGTRVIYDTVAKMVTNVSNNKNESAAMSNLPSWVFRSGALAPKSLVRLPSMLHMPNSIHAPTITVRCNAFTLQMRVMRRLLQQLMK